MEFARYNGVTLGCTHASIVSETDIRCRLLFLWPCGVAGACRQSLDLPHRGLTEKRPSPRAQARLVMARLGGGRAVVLDRAGFRGPGHEVHPPGSVIG